MSDGSSGKQDARTIVITGASDGIGAACARQLVARGENVAIVGRSPSKTAALGEELGAAYHVTDFADLSQVRALAAELLASCPRIDVLANNAGGIFRRQTTADGFDLTLQVNHLAPFLLTGLLMERLIASRASVIATSSVAARGFGHVDVKDLNNARKWSPQKAYGDGKLANILFTRELHRRYHPAGISAVAFHPGSVATSFASDTSSWMRHIYASRLARAFMVPADKAGGELTWLALGTPGVTWLPGEYYERRAPARRVNPQVRDSALAAELWDRSAEMVGLAS